MGSGKTGWKNLPQAVGLRHRNFSDLQFRKVILTSCSEESGLKMTVVTKALETFFGITGEN